MGGGTSFKLPNPAVAPMTGKPFAKGNAAWFNCLRREDAHKQEVDAANAAYSQASELPGYHGDFTNVWFQPELNCRRRFKKGAVPATITG